jgi:predicted AlkP superfamily pyrophosphatase or phosphodiesterase
MTVAGQSHSPTSIPQHKAAKIAAMRILRSLALAAFTLTLVACATHHHRSTPTTTAPVGDAAPVLLISIDGFRADYLDRGITPNLARIVREGVRAQWMNPSYPSLTFPNHYTLVTGLRPDRHGIVHNSMSDLELGPFRLSDRKAVGDGRWWAGEPVWVGASKAGLPTATLFWPGSEAAVQGVRPDRWAAFDPSLPPSDRVARVLDWLSEPAATRPRVATLYFEHLDKASHEHGPDSAEATAAIRTVDTAIGQLLDGLNARDLRDRVNLIVVSDHGMATVERGQFVVVEDMVAKQDADVVSIGQSVGIAPLPGRTAFVEQRLLGKHEHYECWRRQSLPARWHYGQNPRVPPIVCQMHEGWDALPREQAERRRQASTRGSHGYDPALPSMRALFIARGPAFRRGVTLAPFDNVDVYPLLARLVGIVPAENDGDITSFLPALKGNGGP